MTEEIEKILEDFGLNKKECELYLCMLDSGKTSILNLSKETNLKRSTIYLILEGLMKKNLVKIAIRGKKKIYLAEDPEKILDIIEQRKIELKGIMPFLKEKYLEKSEKPKMSFFEGREGVEQVYEMIMDSDDNRIWFGNQESWELEFPLMAKRYDSYAKNKLIDKYSKVIVNKTRGDKLIALRYHKSKKYAHRLQYKLLSSNLMFPDTDNAIWENKVAIISLKKEYFAIVIEHVDIANTYRALFEMAWKSAIEP